MMEAFYPRVSRVASLGITFLTGVLVWLLPAIPSTLVLRACVRADLLFILVRYFQGQQEVNYPVVGGIDSLQQLF